jgi:hypothetical protein
MEQRNFRASSSRVLAGQIYGVHAVAFSPDGRQLASIARTARPGYGWGGSGSAEPSSARRTNRGPFA